MRWLYDNETHTYIEDTDGDVGLEVDAVLLIALRDSLAEALRDDAAELAQKLAAGDLTVQEWVLAMRNLLEQAYLEQYALGKGGTNNLFAADLATLGLMLDAQYRYLQNFAEKVAAGELSAEQTAARAQLYMSSSTQAFERGNGAARGLPVLPQYPGDGRTQCRCITTPDSRVLTRDGWKPMADVEIGEYVLTHRLRWRKVLDKIVKPSQPEHRQVYIRSAGGEWVGATDTHRWYSSNHDSHDGWQDANGIVNLCAMVYTLFGTFVLDGKGEYTYEALLQPVRRTFVEPEQAAGVPGVSFGLSLRESEGYAGRAVQIVQHEAEGESAVDRQETAQAFAFCGSGGSQAATDHICRSGLGYEVAGEAGRSLLGERLGGGQEASDLPLSMGVGAGQRRNTEGVSHPPYQRGQIGRPAGKSGIDEGQSSCSATWCNDPCQDGSRLTGADVRRVRKFVPSPEAGRPGKSFLQPGVLSRLPAQTEGVIDLVFAGAMAVGTPLYDLTVEEDHSFVIEGLFAHNTNCKCNWRIVEYEDRWECFWELNPAEHCKDCVENSRRWKPLVLAKAQANSLATVEQLLPGVLTGTYVAGVPITPARSGNGIARGNAHG